MDEFEDPQWLRALVFGLGAAVAALGSAGLLLAVLDHYSLALALVLGAIVFVALCAASRPLFPRREAVSEAAHVCAELAVVAISLITVWNISNSAHHVLINRDGGTYLNGGKWLAEHGTLGVNPFEGPYAAGSGLGVTSPGMSRQGDHLDFTLEHMVPVLLAEAQALGGDGLMYALVPILGGVALLAFYALARRVLRYPIAALGAMLTLGFLMPQISFSRDSMTEIPVQVLLFTGIWLLCDDRTFRWRGTAFTAGVFLGLTQAMHIDGLAFLVGLPFVCLAVWLQTDPGDRPRVTQTVVACGVGAAIGVALGFIDVTQLSPAYLRNLRVDVERLGMTFVAAFVAAFVFGVFLRNWSREPPEFRARFRRMQQPTAFFASEIVLIGGFAAWLARPQLMTARGSANNVVLSVQKLNELTVDPTRRYFEHAVEWASWYVGPLTLAFAIVAAALATRAFVRGELGAPTRVAALILGPAALLYLWRPSITPDHIWATRRFLPAVFPILVLAAFGLLCYLADYDRLGYTELRRLGAVVLGVATVAFPIYTILHLTQMTEQRGYPAVVARICNSVGPTNAVVVVQEAKGSTWLYAPQTLRSFCDVPVGVMYSGEATTLVPRVPKGKVSGSALRKLALDWADAGRELYIVAGTSLTINKFLPGTDVTIARTEANSRALELTLVHRPKEYRAEGFAVAIARVPLPGE